ncbi:hypothetical protein Heshes_24210 [Alicyclobacillus hesperidum]|uniref:Multiubiquitin n=1 Tax=Alicyclobacillus hesperidum TaxID=89784 RepID=A0A1H2X705_9BACL|nr:multiubiquitin domain-containing protein [Alicyclobacillus hesperidum]GLV14737.1 hypothetical protein Heshes_24210 [Alicyclobacillus hesperidum]SDW88244.1 Multiubiquitin [Alicyclobacillus hesperidum]
MADHDQSHHDHDGNIFIDKKRYPIEKDAMTGSELKSLAGIPQDYELWLEVHSGEDDKIENTQSIELKSGMKFFSVPPVINPGSGR